MGRRALWVVADQAVSSLSNAALGLLVARAVPASEFGAFALAFSLYSLTVAVSQALCAQVVVIRYTRAEDPVWRRAVAAATATALALGAVTGLGLAVVALPLRLPLREVLLAMAVLLPALALQDTWRTVFVARGTPARSFVNDLVWTALQFALLVPLLAAGVTRAVWYVAAWGAAAVVAALLGAVQSGVRPSAAVVPFVRRHRDVSLPAVANALVVMGAVQLTLIVLAGISGVAEVGSLRAAQTLLGPLNIVGFAAVGFAVPEIVRRDLSRRGLTFAALAISGVLVSVDLVWGGLLLLIPDPAGVELLGSTWPGARQALPGLVVFTACIAATTGATAVMRAVARTDCALRQSAALSPLLLILPSLAFLHSGPGSAAWGFAASGALVVPLAWWLLPIATRSSGSAAPPVTT